MNKYEIVKRLAEERQVEKMVFKMLGSSRNPFDCPLDLVQDIYFFILGKDEDFVVSLYDRGELGWYILKVIRNQLLSKNSRYFYLYIKFPNSSDELDKAAHLLEED